MEERIIDDEYGRGIRLKKTKDGYVDVTDELTEEGLVRKIEMPQGGARYDRNYDNHAHYVCVCCGSIEDTPLPFSEELLHLPKDASLVGVEMQIRYRCPACRAH